MTTTSAIPLSNDDEAVIQRSLDVDGTASKTDDTNLNEVYEIARTANDISRQSYRHIALQFPDELLVDAASVVAKLQALCHDDTKFYVLGDTSYGSCCVDEVAAEHVNADCLIHYGRSCFSPTNRLPIIYVFGRLPIDVNAIVDSVTVSIPDKSSSILVVSDSTYMSSQDSIIERLIAAGYQQIVPTYLRSTVERNDHEQWQETLPGRLYKLPPRISSLSEITMLYIGPPSPTLTTTLMTHTSLVATAYSFNPRTSKLQQETTQNIALRRRYAVVQKARDAGVIGIVVGTLGVSRYLELITHLRKSIQAAGKKPYLFAMGKLNPSKMANFAEIDAFVLVACGENSLMESRDFYKPVVTPFELSLALNTKPHESVPWTGDWITDFAKVMTMSKPPESENSSDRDGEDDRDEEAPHFSLVTGKYSSSSKPMYSSLETASDADSALATRSKETALSRVGGLFSPAAQHLKQRQHWSGLGSDHITIGEEESGEDPNVDSTSSTMTEGRKGVARGYDTYRPE